MEVKLAIDVSKNNLLGPACKDGKPRCQLREGFNRFTSPIIKCIWHPLGEHISQSGVQQGDPLGEQAGVALSRKEGDGLVQHTEGYSGRDMASCIADVLLEPVRELEHATCWRDQYCPCDSTHPKAMCQILADIPPQQVRF